MGKSANVGSGIKQAPVFDEIYKQLLADVSAIDLKPIGDRPGSNIDGKEAVIRFYGIPPSSLKYRSHGRTREMTDSRG